MPRPKVTRFELQLLEQLWKLGSASVREVQENLPEKDRPAYPRVQTIMYRLEEKKAVRRVKKIGNAHIFEPVATRKAVYRRLVDDLLDLFGGSAAPMMSHLAESGKLSLEDIRQAERILARLEKRRRTMPATAPDGAAARARLQDTQAALDLVKRQAAQSEIRAPIGGVVYGLAIRPGAYLNPGDLVANIGLMNRLRVRVYIDEPELGRVAKQQPVTITWQALAGKQWQGVVEQMPTTIETLGSRQVGQVICMIENPGRELDRKS